MPSLLQRLRGLGQRTSTGRSGVIRLGGAQFNATSWEFTRVANSVYGNPTGYACIQRIAGEMARPAFQVFPPGTSEDPILNHPLLDVLNRPDPTVSGTMMMRSISRDLELTGKSFLLKMQGVDGYGFAGPVTGLRRLPPQRVTVLGDQDDDLVGFIYTDRQGGRQAALPENIVYLRYPHPERDYDGLAPALVAGLPAETDASAARFNYDLLSNDGALPGYMSVEDLTKDELREFKATWESGEFPGKTRFLGGKATYTKVGMSNQEMQYDTLRTMSQKDIARGMGVPWPLLEPTDATFSNMGEARASFWQANILGKLTLIADEFTIQLGFDAGVDIGFKLDDIDELTEAEDALVTRLTLLLDRQAVTINEAREDLGMEPVKWGDEPLQPVGPMKVLHATPVGEDPAAAPPGEVAVADAPPKKPQKELMPGLIKASSTGPNAATWKTFDRKVRAHEKRLQRQMDAFFARQGRVVSARIEAQRGKSLAKTIKRESWWDDARWEKELAADLAMTYGDVVDTFGTDLAVKLGTEFDPSTPSVRDFIESESVQDSKYINATTSEALKKTIADHEEAGEGIDEIAKAIRGYFEGTDAQVKARAEVVARTEVLSAANRGSLEAAKQSGVVGSKVFLTAADDRVDEECDAMDGEEVKLDEPFSSGDDAPPIHPQCRCTAIYTTADGNVTEEGD